MNAVVKKTYKTLFDQMTSDILTIPKPSLSTDELIYINGLLSYWNTLVKRATYWRTLATKKLPECTQTLHIHRYVKRKLIEECKKIILELSQCVFSSYQARLRRKEILAELKDRKEYITATF